jgi:hypothetical protein
MRRGARAVQRYRKATPERMDESGDLGGLTIHPPLVVGGIC